jgi:hypothetical protein
MTVLDFVTDAYFIAGIISEVESPSAQQGSRAVTRLNDIMASLAEDGIDLGYNPKSSVSDTLDLPLGHVEGLKALLAVKLCSANGVPIPGSALEDAERCYNRLLGQAVSMQIERAQSNTLPCGENQHYGYDITRGY